MPFLPGTPFTQLLLNVAIVSYGAATLATGVTLLVIYLLRGFGLA